MTLQFSFDEKIMWESNNSSELEHFIDLYSEFIDDTDSFRYVFHLMNVPADLTGLFSTMSALTKVIPIFVNNCANDSDRDRLTALSKTFSGILAHKSLVDFDSRFEREHLSSYSTHKFCKSRPVFSALLTFDCFYESNSSGKLFNEYLLSTYLLASIICWGLLKIHRREHLSLSVRTLITDESFNLDYPAIMAGIDTSTEGENSLSRFIRSFDKNLLNNNAEETYLPEVTDKHIAHFANIYKLFDNDIKTHDRPGNRGPKKSYSRRKKSVKRTVIETDPNDSLPSYSLLTTINASPQQLESISKIEKITPLAMPLSDILEKNESIEIEFESISVINKKGESEIIASNPTTLSDPLSRRHQTKNIANAITSRNQGLPNQWDQLNRFDLYHLIQSTLLLEDDKSFSIDANDIPFDFLKTIILLCLTTGRTLEQLQTTKYLYEPPSETNVTQGYSYFYIKMGRNNEVEKSEFIFSADLIEPDKTQSASDLYYKTERYLHLTPPVWLTKRIDKYKDFEINQSYSKSFLLKKIRITELQKEVSKFLSKVNKKNPGCRLTLTRICHVLWQRCTQMTGVDVVEASYLMGAEHILSATPLYYTLLDTGRLKNVYSQVWYQFEEEINEEARAHAQAPLFSSTSQLSLPALTSIFEYVGSKKTPKLATIKMLTSTLIDKLQNPTEDASNYQLLVDKHNYFTLYCYYFFAYASGYRAVRDPFPDLRLWNRRSQFICIADKTAEDGYNARLVYLPDKCSEQLNTYVSYLSRFNERLALCFPDTYKELLHQSEVWTELPAKIGNHKRVKYDANRISPLFLIVEGQWHRLSPQNIKSFVEEFYNVPANVHRHYVRSKLVESQCPTEVINAFMGHWVNGLEPLGMYSSLSLQAYSKQLSIYMPGILKACGFKVINEYGVEEIKR